MKKLFYFFCFIYFFIGGNKNLLAQRAYPGIFYYYIEEKEVDNLEPITKSRELDQTLNLIFKDVGFNAFVNGQTVYVYEKAFPGALTERLQRMYIVGSTSDTLLNDFRIFSNISYSDFLGTLEYEELSVPDDYFSTANIPVQAINGIMLPTDSFEHLELVNARQAWNLSTGNPNIAIGVVDSPINPNHPDLINNIIQHYGPVPTSFPAGEHHHGTKVVGSAVTGTNNGLGISSIGYNTSLVTYVSYYNATGSLYTLPQKMLYLVQNHPEIKVITHSRLESCNFIEANALVYQEIWEQYGVTVITAAGNGNYSNHCPDENGGNQGYVYPASYDHVISVSGVGHNTVYGSTNSQGMGIGWKDVHEYFAGDDNYTFTHNDKVDVVAPGYGIPSTNLDNKYATGYGTSYSGPFVCGIAALMYDVNPNITPDQVRQILRETAEESIYDIPENAPYIGLLGTGRVNAYAAVLQAKCLYTQAPGLDLTIRNSKDDFGVEPDNVTDPIWDSPDIWVRNQPDGLLVQENQDLNYLSDQTPVYVYVKVTNKSCETSLGTEQLYLYWAKGGLSQVWPTIWTGSILNGLPTGDDIGNLSIPTLAPGETKILEFQWIPENPDVYETNGFSKPWMFCFLARIVAPNDPMTFVEGSNAATNTRNNNNIAYKNATVLNVSGGPKGTITAGNMFNDNPTTVDFNFYTIGESDTNIWDQAEVYVKLDKTIWDNWQSSGGLSNNIRIVDATKHVILLTGNNANLSNINFSPGEWGLITLGVNFLTEKVGQQEKFAFHIE